MEQTFRLAALDLGVIAGYILLILIVGLALSRQKDDSAEGYFLAGRSMIWPFIGISLFASNISSNTLVGLAGAAYDTGIAVFNYEWMATFVLAFYAIFMLPFVLRARVFTMPEFLERRYDGRARVYFSILTLILNIVVDTAGSLYAGGLVLRMVWPDIALWQIIAGLAVLAGLYTILGGLAAVIYTDALQGLILLVGAAVIAVIAYTQAGGWDAVLAQVAPEKLSLIRPADAEDVPWPGLIFGVSLLGFYFWCTNQFMAQRVLGALNEAHGRWGALFAGLLKLPVLFLMVLPGTFAILLYPDLDQPDLVFPTLMFDLLPVGLLGLVFAGFIAALMSQIDSTLNSASTLVTMDFIAPNRPDLSARQLKRIGQLVTFGFMVLAVAWAPQIERFGNLFAYLQAMLSYTVPPVVALILIGLFWRRANATGAIYALIGGGVAGAVFFAVNEVPAQRVIHFLYVAPILFGVSALLLVLGSQQAPAPPAHKVEPISWSPAFFRDETAALRRRPWWQNYRLHAAGLVVLTLAIVIAFW
ncbi:MAG: sodium:solute symporter [Rhodothalassiaceae bacterium]